jgi:hypothetical protein
VQIRLLGTLVEANTFNFLEIDLVVIFPIGCLRHMVGQQGAWNSLELVGGLWLQDVLGTQAAARTLE